MLRSLLLVLLPVSALIMGGCKRESPPLSMVEAEQANISEGKAVAAAVVKEWGEKREKLSGNPRTDAGKAGRVLYGVIESLPREQQNKLCMYLTSKKPKETDISEEQRCTEWEMTMTLINVFIMTKDKERLVKLLSRKCLRTMGSDPIEFVLAVYAQVRDDALQEPISVLAESYSKATNDEAKNTLRGIFGCAFPSLRKKISDDTEFVNACTQWYKENRSQLTVNMNYLDNFEGGAFRLGPSPELFVFKEQKDKGE